MGASFMFTRMSEIGKVWQVSFEEMNYVERLKELICLYGNI